MSDVSKARREIFTLLHHGLDILAYRTPGGAQQSQPLEGGYELLALSQALEKLPQLCLEECALDAAELRRSSQEALECVLAWVAPQVRVPAGSGTQSAERAGVSNEGDKALRLLEIGLKLISADLNAWVHGEYKEDVVTPANLAGMMRKVPYQVQGFQEGTSSQSPLVALIERLPSYSSVTRIMESSGTLAPQSMLEILLDESLEGAARWVSRGSLRSDPLGSELKLLAMHDEISKKPLMERPVTWLGSNAGKLVKKMGIADLNGQALETAVGLSSGFLGSLEELVRASQELT